MTKRFRPSALLAATLLAATALAAAPASAQADPARPAELSAAVADAWSADPGTASLTSGDRRTVSGVMRSTGTWAFGTANSVSATELPEGRLYLAHRTAEGWTVAFERTDEFADLGERAPASVITPDEVELLGPVMSVQENTGLGLPYSGTWTMAGGPHGWAGSDRPYSAMDLWGGDGVVRAAGPGRAYAMCSIAPRGWVRVYHDNGYSTDYYHLFNNVNPGGARVVTGQRLGDIGTDITCGGSANGNHVHFALLSGTTRIALEGRTIGGWTFHEGSSAYGGYAVHNGTYRYVGDALYNYGGGDGSGLYYQVTASDGLNARTGPYLSSSIGATYAYGTTLHVVCQTNAGDWDGVHRYPGTTPFRTWDKLSNGLWVYDWWMNTPVIGSDGYSPGIPHC